MTIKVESFIKKVIKFYVHNERKYYSYIFIINTLFERVIYSQKEVKSEFEEPVYPEIIQINQLCYNFTSNLYVLFILY